MHKNEGRSVVVSVVVFVAVMAWFTGLVIRSNGVMDSGKYTCATVQLGKDYARVCTALIKSGE